MMVFGFYYQTPLKQGQLSFYNLGAFRSYLSKENVGTVTRVFVRTKRNK